MWTPTFKIPHFIGESMVLFSLLWLLVRLMAIFGSFSRNYVHTFDPLFLLFLSIFLPLYMRSSSHKDIFECHGSGKEILTLIFWHVSLKFYVVWNFNRTYNQICSSIYNQFQTHTLKPHNIQENSVELASILKPIVESILYDPGYWRLAETGLAGTRRSHTIFSFWACF